METSYITSSDDNARHPVSFYIKSLICTVNAVLLRLLCLLPLLSLVVFPADSPFCWLALPCPVLYLTLVLPLRFSFAEALIPPYGTSRFSLDTAANMKHYGEKVTEGILHALHVLKWGIPTLALLVVAYYQYTKVDMLTLLNGIKSLGHTFGNITSSIANFFLHLFGKTDIVSNNVDLVNGIYAIFLIVGITLLIWIYGAVRNSATRFIWVTATRNEKNPSAEVRRQLRGRRLKQLGTALLNLCLLLPFLCVTAASLKDVISQFSTQMMTILATHQLPALDVANTFLPILGAFLLLYLPLLPIRRMLTARFAVSRRRG